jgi:hypothetical protein
MVRATAVFASALAVAGCVVRTVTLPPLENVAVRGFVGHAEREWPAGPSQAQTADTLDWLVSAVESLANNRRLPIDNLNARVREFRALLKEFAGSAENVGRTRDLRRAFVAGAGLVDDLLFAAGLAQPGGRSPLRRAAESLDESRLPRQQTDVIERYFGAASEALQRVDRGV